VFAGLEAEVHIVQQVDPAVGHEGKILHLQVGLERERPPAFGLQRPVRLGVEELHRAVVGDFTFLVDLVKLDQLLPGIIELFLGRQKGYQRS